MSTEPAPSLTELEIRSELFDAMDGNLRMSRRKKLLDAYREAVLAAAPVPPPTDQTALRDRIRRAVCEAEGFAWDTDMLEPDEYGEAADAVLAVLPDVVDRAALIAATVRACAEHLRDRYSDTWTEDAARSLELNAARIERGEQTALLRRLAAEAQPTTKPEPEPESCAHCGKTIRRITGTLTEWRVHDPGGHTMCVPELAASSPRATPRPAAGAEDAPPVEPCPPGCVACATDESHDPAPPAGVRQDGAQPQETCGKTRSADGTEYRPCALTPGHPEAYCQSADGMHLFLAMGMGDPL